MKANSCLVLLPLPVQCCMMQFSPSKEGCLATMANLESATVAIVKHQTANADAADVPAAPLIEPLFRPCLASSIVSRLIANRQIKLAQCSVDGKDKRWKRGNEK